MNNGPELVAWARRDWCRVVGTATAYIEPGSPWENPQNPFVESFNGRVRDELLNGLELATVLEAEVVVEAWGPSTTPTDPIPRRHDPAEYAKAWTSNQPALP